LPSPRLPWLLVCLTLRLTLFVRFRLRDMPLEPDEGEYACVGQLILHGVPPYQAASNLKLPGTYAAYALIMTVFGQSPAGIHTGIMLVNAASIIFVFLLGRKLLDDTTAVVAAVVFALLSLSPSILGLAGHASHFVVLFALGGTLLLVVSNQWSVVSGLPRRSVAKAGHWLLITDHWSLIFLSGILFGLAFLMKQPGLLFGLFGTVYLVRVKFRESREGKLSRSRPQRSDPPSSHSPTFPLAHSLGACLLFAVGLILPYILTCLILAAYGVFHNFIFWTITYASQYASAVSLSEAADLLPKQLELAVGPNFLLWLLPIAGGLMMWWDARLRRETARPRDHKTTRPRDYGNKRPQKSEGGGQRAENGGQKPEATSEPSGSEGRFRVQGSSSPPLTPSPSHSLTRPPAPLPSPRFFLAAFTLCSLAAVSAGFYFRQHYFIMLLPAISLLAGLAVSRSIYLLRFDRTIELFLAGPVLLLFITGIAATLIGNGLFWFAMSPTKVVDEIYGSTLISEARKAADYIKSHASKDDTIAVLGSEPEIYFYARRWPPTPFLYTYPLVEKQAYARKMQQEMITDIERVRPGYAIYVDDFYSWLPAVGSDSRIFEWWRSYSASNYDLEAAFPVVSTKESSSPPDPRFGNSILVFKRKTAK